MDRRLANRTGRRDLARLATGRWQPGRLGFAYTLLLVIASTLIYAVTFALLCGSAALLIKFALESAWLGVVVCGIVAVAILISLFVGRPDLRGVEASRERFPRLWAALDEVAGRVGARLPQRVVLLPGTAAFVFQHRPARRLFRRERVLALGVGYLPLLSEGDLKALLAHELAHYRHGHTVLHRYVGGAQRVLEHLIETLLDAVGVQSNRNKPMWMRRSRSATLTLGAAVMWLPTLPLRVLHGGFHLLRLAESRAAEFDADRTAIQAYGSQTLVDMLTALSVTTNTFWGSSASLRAEMVKHRSQNYYAELRRHYAELPPAVIAKLQREAIREFRSLELSHPITPDRLRAAAAAKVPIPADTGAGPANAMIVPEGAQSAESIEIELTTLLFAKKKGRR